MNRSIASLKGVEGVSVTSMKGKLEVLQKYNEHLGRDSDFDDDWRGEVESLVEACNKRRLSVGNGGKALLLTSLRKGIIGNYRGITSLTVVVKVFCKVHVGWCSV